MGDVPDFGQSSVTSNAGSASMNNGSGGDNVDMPVGTSMGLPNLGNLNHGLACASAKSSPASAPSHTPALPSSVPRPPPAPTPALAHDFGCFPTQHAHDAEQTPACLLRIRAGIEGASPSEVYAGLQQADVQGVTLTPNVRNMISQWLAVNNSAPRISIPSISLPASITTPPAAPRPVALPTPSALPTPPTIATPSAIRAPASTPVHAPAISSAESLRAPLDLSVGANDDNIRPGVGAKGWSTMEHAGRHSDGKALKVLPYELLRTALLRIFEGGPRGSDAAVGLGIVEGEEGTRFLPLAILGSAVGFEGQESHRENIVRVSIREAPTGIFTITSDGRNVGLVEWPGWDEFSTSLKAIAAATRDPAFEPRSLQYHIARPSRGAVRAGNLRQNDALRSMQEALSPSDCPEDVAPALRSAISRRTRLALACLIDGIAAAGLGPEAGPDSLGLVGQLPRTLFGLTFNNIDSRDKGACAFLGELVQSWDRRRCFSKRWLQDAVSKFQMPKGPNIERDEGRGWYGLMAERLSRQPDGKLCEGEMLPRITVSLSEVEGDDLAVHDGRAAEKEREVILPPLPEIKTPATGTRPEKSKRAEKAEKADRMEKKTERVEKEKTKASGKTEKAEKGDHVEKRSGEKAVERQTAQKRTSIELDKSSASAAVAEKNEKVKKRRGIVQEEDDDETVARHIQESRARRAALMAKYQAPC